MGVVYLEFWVFFAVFGGDEVEDADGIAGGKAQLLLKLLLAVLGKRYVTR